MHSAPLAVICCMYGVLSSPQTDSPLLQELYGMTVAKLYGKLLCELGFLSSGEVIVVGASKLTGAHEGATNEMVYDLLHSAAGKVLFTILTRLILLNRKILIFYSFVVFTHLIYSMGKRNWLPKMI